MSFKPDGYTSLAPYLLVPDPEATLQFCEAVFGAVRLRVIPDAEGGIQHAECRIDDTVLMMGGMDGAPGATLHLYLTDPDGVFARALERGAEELQPVADKDDGDRRGGFRAPDGTAWYVARQV